MEKKGIAEGKENSYPKDGDFGEKIARKLEASQISADEFNEQVEEGKILNTKLIALFVIGVLIGITLKTHAVRTITMGFEDYKLARYTDDFSDDESEGEQAENEAQEEMMEEGQQGEEDVIIE